PMDLDPMDRDRADLPTYTSIFRFERRLYAIYDWELPVPVSLFQLVAFLGALVATLVTTGLLGIEASAGTAWVFVVPPATAAYLASQPLVDAKRPHAFLFTQARYLTEPRALNRLRPERALVRVGFGTTVGTRGRGSRGSGSRGTAP
ncbi:MAG: conjugal transfer protein, partial [Acidimicrobiia bacterium]